MTKQGTDFGDDFLSDPIKDTLDSPEGQEPKGKPGRPAKATLVDDEPPAEPPKEPEPKPKDEPPADPKDNEPKNEPKDDDPKEGDEDEDFIASLASKLGYELGEDEAYEDSEEGLIAFIEKQKEIGAQELVTNYFNNVHPKAGELFDLVNMIADLPGEEQEEIISEFFKGKSPELDYKSIDLKDENVQKSVLRTFFRNNGYSDEQITKKIEKFEIAGLLEDESTEAAALLAKAQEKAAAEVIKREKDAADKRRRDSELYYQNLRKTVDSGKVGEFTIPVSERKAVFEFIAKGEALNKINELWATPEGRVQLAILLKNDFKLDKYISREASTQRVTGLKERLKVGNSKLKSSDPRDNQTADWDDGQIQFAKK